MADSLLDSAPARTLKADVTVMLQRTRDELPPVQQPRVPVTSQA